MPTASYIGVRPMKSGFKAEITIKGEKVRTLVATPKGGTLKLMI